MSLEVMNRLRALRPEDAARVDELFPAERRAELLEHIIGTGRPVGAPRGRAPGHRLLGLFPKGTVPRRSMLFSTLGVLAAAAIAAVFAATSAVQPQPAGAAVTFRTASDGAVIATVTNPLAARAQLETAFTARGFHITVNLLPVSPSLVGTAVYISDDGGASSIQALEKGHCTGGGGCPVGVKIPRTFKGNGYITLGRPAKPGEQYESSGQATAPGEAMHGLQFQGHTVATVLALLRARHVTVPQYRWQTGNYGKVLRRDEVPMSWHVSGASPWAPGQVLLFVRPGS